MAHRKRVRPKFEPVRVDIRRTILPCGICGKPIPAADVEGKPQLYHMECMKKTIRPL